MTAEPVCVTHGKSGEHPNEDAPCQWPGPAPAELTPHPAPSTPGPGGRRRDTFEFSGSPAWSGTPVVNGHRLETVSSIDVRIRHDEIPMVTLGLKADAVRLALGGDVAVGVTDETREALTSLGWSQPGALLESLAFVQREWTPEQVADFRAQWESLMADGGAQARWLPQPRTFEEPGFWPDLIVLRFCWTDSDGSPCEEIYGPWPTAEDDSHLEHITAFIRDWPARSGCQPSSVTMAIALDPAAWAASRQQEGQQ